MIGPIHLPDRDAALAAAAHIRNGEQINVTFIRMLAMSVLARPANQPAEHVDQLAAAVAEGCGRTGGELTENGCPACGPDAVIYPK